MIRIEMNVKTGVRTVVELTPDEISEAVARAEAEAIEKAKPKPKTLLERVIALEDKVK
jgi:hypothetical protein